MDDELHPDAAPIQGLTSGVYERTDGKFGWRIVDQANGQIIATDGGQGYSRRVDAEHTYERVLAGAEDAPHDADYGGDGP